MLAAISAGCSSLLGIDDLRLAEDAMGGPDTPGANCIGGGLLRVCPDPPPTSQLVISGPQEIDTDGDPSCVTMMSGTTEVCVIVHASIEIASTGTLRAVGRRPLALASMSAISVLGMLDAASVRGKKPGAGADPLSCPLLGAQLGDNGGPGGSFGGVGGGGGNGGMLGPPAVALVEIRGGCHGGRGGNVQTLSGPGGGAVYLIAKERILVDGIINASGAGGDGALNGIQPNGGAGGASGGLIGLDAPAI